MLDLAARGELRPKPGRHEGRAGAAASETASSSSHECGSGEEEGRRGEGGSDKGGEGGRGEGGEGGSGRMAVAVVHLGCVIGADRRLVAGGEEDVMRMADLVAGRVG